jgi:glycosyltransferase involved in cell wall biosynthesis
MAKLLISAYACEPGQGSEEGIGWGSVTQVAQSHDVWVITRANNRAAIDRDLAQRPMPSVRFIYFDLPSWARFWKRGTRGVHAYYYLWQIGAYFIALKLHREVKFDLAHHVTFAIYWMPSFLPLLGIPFVWGPVAGGESIPRNFWRSLPVRGRIFEALRITAQTLGEFDPFVNLAARRAAVALATSTQTEQRLRSLGCQSILVLPSVHLPQGELRELAALPLRQCAPFRVVSIGRLLHWKGFELGLRAFADFHALFPNSEYWLIGDGPERQRLERFTRRRGLQEAVRFWGMLPRDEAFKKLADSDVALLPSLHESGGYASLEAMAAGRPVICLDLGGPALQVTDETGIKISAISPRGAIRDLTGALTRLANNPELRVRLALAGRERAKELFDWEKRGALFSEVYSKALNSSPANSNDQPIRNTI